MKSRNIAAAEREVVATLNGKPSRGDGKSARAVLRLLSLAAAVAVGSWITVIVWPLWTDYRDRKPPKPDALSAMVAPAIPAPAPAPNVSTSVLGTDSSISETPSQLVLVSTSMGRVPQDSTASLGTDPRNPQVYALGSVLANGAIVTEIRADRVVLSLNGKRSTLVVDRDAPAKIAMRDTLAKQKNASPTVLESLATKPGANDTTVIGGKQASKYPIDRVVTSRDDFSQVMRSQVVFERDKIAGFKIFAGTRPAALTQLGLKEGDIVRSVDGKSVRSETALQSIDDAVSTGGSIVVGIERDGSLMSVSLDGAQLTQSASALAQPPNT